HRARLRRPAIPRQRAAHGRGGEHPGPPLLDRWRSGHRDRGGEPDRRGPRPDDRGTRRGCMNAATREDPAVPPLRAGVVGLGMMGRNHVRVYEEVLPAVELIAVADPDPVALRKATTGRVARGYPDPRTMFDEEHLDLVSIVAPTSLHRQVTMEALASGANVLVEKPIASDRADAEAMISAAQNARLLLTVGHIERFNPAIRELRRRLAAGELGRIFQVKATRLGPFPARIRDVGVVLDLAPHDIDVMRFLLDSEPIRLYAETEQR